MLPYRRFKVNGKDFSFLPDALRILFLDPSGAVATANPVNDVQVILFREAVLILFHIVQHGAPTIAECTVAFPEGNSNQLEAKLVSQLFGNGLVAPVIQFACVDIGGLGFDAEHILGIFFVGNAHIHIFAQLGHKSTTTTLAGMAAKPT